MQVEVEKLSQSLEELKRVEARRRATIEAKLVRYKTRRDREVRDLCMRNGHRTDPHPSTCLNP